MGYGTVRPDTGRADPIFPHISNAGETSDYYFYFYLESGLIPANYINIQFPSEFINTGFVFMVTQCYVNEVESITGTCSINGNTITLQVFALINRNFLTTVRIAGLTNLSTPKGTSYFKIWTSYLLGGQIIDINESFEGIGFGPAVTTMTGSVTVATGADLVAMATSMTFKFQANKEILSGTLFRFTFPDIYTVGTTLVCTATAYDASTAALAGTFSCQKYGQEVIIYGLETYLPAYTRIAFSITGLTNASYTNSAAASNIYIDTIRENSQLILERATVATPEIKAGPLINVTVEPYNAGYVFSRNNVMWTKLTFGVTNEIPEGGSITVTYHADIATVKTGQIDCWLSEGVPRTAAGGFPTCTITNGGTSASITGFGTIAAGTTIGIVNQNTLSTSNISFIGIETKDASSRTIDKDDGTQGAITLDTKSNFASSSVTYATATAKTETANIVLSLQPGVSFNEGSTIEVWVPSGFTIPSGISIACEWEKDGVGYTSLSSCSYTSGKITAVTANSSHNLANTDTGNLRLTASSGNWSTPDVGSSPSYIYEWGIAITASGSSSYDNWGCVYSEIAPAAFTTGTGNTEFLLESSSAGFWTPYTIKFKVDNEITLGTSNTSDLIANFYMKDADDANAWTAGLGSSLSATTAIGCTTTILANLSTTETVTCSLVPASGLTSADYAQIKITNFSTITAGDLVTVKVLLKNPGTADTNYQVTLTSQTTDYNGIVTTIQTIALTDITITTTASDFTTKTLAARSEKTVNALTSFVATLQLDTSATIEKILWVLPAGWNVAAATGSITDVEMSAVEVHQNTYAPGVFMTLPSDQNLSNTATSSVTLSSIYNPAYAGIGSGSLYVAALVSGQWHNASILDSTAAASEVGVLGMTIGTNNFHNNGGDGTYIITLTTANPIPAGGEIHIDFPTGYSLTNAGCDLGSAFTDQVPLTTVKDCTISLLNVKITQFAAITAGTELVVYINTVKNPNLTDPKTTDTFTAKTQYDSNASNLIDQILTGKTLELTEDLTAGTAEVTGIDFYPKNSGSKSDMLLSFNLQSSVPKTGTITITVPGGYTLPAALSSTNCILNEQYLTCLKIGNDIQIMPADRFEAGTQFELLILDLQSPTSGASTTYFAIEVAWNGLTFSQTADTGLTFTPTEATLSELTVGLEFFPTNASQLARYEFTITLGTTLTPGGTFFIWFPSEYPTDLGDVICELKAVVGAASISTTCEKGDGRPYIKIDNSALTFAAAVPFVAIINNVSNPSAQGTTGAFAVSTIVDSSIVDELKSTLTAIITPIPGLMQVFNITTESIAKQDETVYTFNLLPQNSIVATTGEVWIRFPDYDYTWELPGFSTEHSCDTQTLSASGTSTEWYTPNCTNTYSNIIIANGDSSPAYNDFFNVLSIEVESVKSPASYSTTKNFLIATYDSSTKAYIDRTYGTASDDDLLTFKTSKFQTFVGDGSQTVTVGSGVKLFQTIRTASPLIPAKSSLVFTPTISTKSGDTTGFEIVPPVITIEAGTYSAQFIIAVSADLSFGEFLVTWSLTVPSTEYVAPISTMYQVVSAVVYPLLMDTVPPLIKGQESLPIYFYLPLATAETGVGLNITAETEGISVNNTCSEPGSPVGSFTITTDGDQEQLFFGLVKIELDCDNKNSFVLAGSPYLGFSIVEYDDVKPGLASFVINSPKSRMQADMTIQTEETCTFYWTYGERGLPAQTNTMLIDGAGNKTDNYFDQAIGTSLVYDFSITGLSPESDYILYGLLVDQAGNEMEEPFIIEFNTAEYYDSVTFTTGFTDPEPTDTQKSIDIPDILRTLLGVEVDRIKYQAPQTSTRRRLSTYEVQYLFYNEPTSVLPSPQNLINSFAITSELVTRFAAIGLNYDPTHNLAGTVVPVPNPRPTWSKDPEVTPSSNSITVNLAVSTSGKMYAILFDDEAQLPSSRQVTNLSDAFGNPAEITVNSTVVAENHFNFTIPNLNPASSYTLLISAENDDSRLKRIMRDDVMAKLEVITSAATGSQDTDDESMASIMAFISFWFLF